MRLTRIILLSPPFSLAKTIVVPGAEYVLGAERTHFKLDAGRLHYALGRERTHYELREENDDNT